MARSTYVYTVVHDYGHSFLLLGSFTVKHEMVSAVRRWLDHGHPLPKLRILRAHDGGGWPMDDITAQFTWGVPNAQDVGH